MFVLYALLGVACALVYRGCRRARRRMRRAGSGPLRHSRRIVYTLAALFSLDAFGGGLIVQSMLALWLFERFALSIAAAGMIFFWTGVLSALSYLVAVRIANRIGLVNTMVFTHLPSSVLLMLVPFAPNLATCVGLLLVRSALSQMDVPTRSVVRDGDRAAGERAAAASITSVPRSLASATEPAPRRLPAAVSGFGWPLVVAGGLKIAYDLLLLAFCRTLRVDQAARILDVLDLVELDVAELAVRRMLDLADVDVLDDVARRRVDRHRPARALPRHALHRGDELLAVGVAAGLLQRLVDEVHAVVAADRHEVRPHAAVRLHEGVDVRLVLGRRMRGRIVEAS